MRKIRFFLISIVILSVLLTATALVAAETAALYDLDYARSNNGIIPVLTVAANSPKLNSKPGLAGFKCNDGENGFDTSLPGTFTFDLGGSASFRFELAADTEGNIFIKNWESTGAEIRQVLVKGGNGYLTYTYDGSQTSDGNLYPPMTGKDFKNVSGISHISVFYVVKNVESTAGSDDDESAETTVQTGGTQPLSDIVTDSTTPDPTENTPQDTTGETSAANLPEEDLPLASLSTDASADSTNETMTSLTTINLTGEAIPRTGESDSSTSLMFGIVLIAMAAGLGLIVMRNKRVNN